MKQVPVWKGSDIGHGKRGGVLHVGAHVVHVGCAVPEGLSKEAMAIFREKDAIVDDLTDKDKAKKQADETAQATEVAAKEAKAESLKAAKKQKTATAKALKEAEQNAAEAESAATSLDDELGIAQTGLSDLVEAAGKAQGDEKVSLGAQLKEMTEAFNGLRERAEVAISAATEAANVLAAAQATDDAVADEVERLK